MLVYILSTLTGRGGGGNIFTHKGGKDNNDVQSEEEDVSKANILASKASKISAGARILRGP